MVKHIITKANNGKSKINLLFLTKTAAASINLIISFIMSLKHHIIREYIKPMINSMNPSICILPLASAVVAVLLYFIYIFYKDDEKNQILATNNKAIADIIIVHIIVFVHNGNTSENMITTNKTKNKTAK